MFISVQRVKTYDFNKKNFENSLLLSIQISKKFLSIFPKIQREIFWSKFFFHFLDVSGENTHFGENNREKNDFTILTSDKTDVRLKLTFDISN